MSSSLQLRRSASGTRKAIATRAAGRTACPRPSARISTGCGARTVNSRSSWRFYQKRQPGLLGRRTRSTREAERLECELLDRRRFRTQAEARMARSSSSRASTIRDDATPPSAISRTTSAAARRSKRSFPAHISLRSCSGPSRCGCRRCRRVRS